MLVGHFSFTKGFFMNPTPLHASDASSEAPAAPSSGHGGQIANFPTRSSTSTGPQPSRPQTQQARVEGAPNAASARDPILPSPPVTVTIDTARDQITSSLHQSVSTHNAQLLLQQGITISGTHYGLQLISTGGVVILAKDAKILPSPQQPSRIIAKRIAIQGDVLADVVQGDETMLICDTARLRVEDLVYGRTFVTAEGGELHVRRALRKLSSRERTAEAWLEEHSVAAQGVPASFDEAIRADYAQMEAQEEMREERSGPDLRTA